MNETTAKDDALTDEKQYEFWKSEGAPCEWSVMTFSELQVGRVGWDILRAAFVFFPARTYCFTASGLDEIAKFIATLDTHSIPRGFNGSCPDKE